METVAVGQWQTLWSDIYSHADSSPGEERNLAGWTSSYTGRPIAPREMAESVDRTVERILDLKPRRLLEIGCGMGLLLKRLAPACEECWGIDFSAEAVAALRRDLAGRLPITVRQQPADDLSGLPRGCFDTIVLNSVVQYFPGSAYFCRVLSALRGVTAPGARIFLGDLRSRPHLRTFHLSVLLQQADCATPLSEIRERLACRVQRERELVLAPAYFTTLPGLAHVTGLPGISRVDVQLKRGRAKNELTRFRYDAVLTLAGGPAYPAAPPPERRLDWREADLSLASLRRLLAEERPGSLRISGVPNARLAAEVTAESLLDSGAPELHTVADLQAAVRALRTPAVEPEDLWGLSCDLPYQVGVHWGAGPDTLDLMLRRL